MRKKKLLEIAERVIALRKAKDISQAELSRRVGLSKGAMSQFERGIIGLTAENLGEIAKALFTSTDYLIFGKENKDLKTNTQVLFKRMLANDKFMQIINLTDDPEIKNLIEQIKNFSDQSK